MQKLVRAAFGTNNVDTCARVCHSPTGYGLKHTLGESAGTQAFDSVKKADVDHGHRRQPDRRPPGVRLALKQRLRQGAKLIVVDPRAIDLVQTPHVEADSPPAAAARHQRRGDQRARPRHRHRGADEGRLHRRALRAQVVRGVEGVHRRPAPLAGGDRVDHRRAGGARARGRAPVCRRPATAPSTTASASPSTARARPW